MAGRKLSTALALLTIAGCETAAPIGTGGGNFAAGSSIGSLISSGDRAALSPVFVEAVEHGDRGRAYSWNGPRASGAVTPGAYLVGNLWPEPAKLMPLAGRVSLVQPMQTELGLYAVAKTANVRSAPSPEAPVLATLSPGEAADAVGKTSGQPWILVATGGVIRGFVHESLLLKAPGSDLQLAGGPTKTAWRCREFQQDAVIGAQKDRWTGTACDRGQGWRLVATESKAGF
jgi:uncharacterized protein YgiM (DUF1202 family)